MQGATGAEYYGEVISRLAEYHPKASGIYTATFEQAYSIEVLPSEHGSLEVTLEDGWALSAIPYNVKGVVTPCADEGYEAVGFFIYGPDKDGNDSTVWIEYVDGEFSFLMPNINARFRGMFIEEGRDPVYTISYDANGGQGQAVSEGVEIGRYGFVESESIYWRDGYCFDCWNTAADGSGKEWFPGDMITPDGDMTLYAQWEKEPGKWGELKEQLEYNSYVTLYEDVEAGAGDEAIVIASGRNVTLDLAGRTLSAGALAGSSR